MLEQGNCVKRFTAVSSDKLEADAGESFLIKGLYVKPETDNDYLTLKVDRKTVGVYRIYGRSGNHLSRMHNGYIGQNLMDFLTEKGINCSIPIAEGQVFSVVSSGSSPEVVVVYDSYAAGDIRADMPNGTASKEYMFIQYMDTSETTDAEVDYTLDTSLSPAEFPDFPCGKAAPANTEVSILGLIGCPCGTGLKDTNGLGTSFVKLIKDRETLFDEDRAGIPFRYLFSDLEGAYNSDFSLIGSCTPFRYFDGGMGLTFEPTLGEPLIFEPALKFVSGEELLVKLTMIKDTSAIELPAGSIDLAAIMNVKVS